MRSLVLILMHYLKILNKRISVKIIDLEKRVTILEQRRKILDWFYIVDMDIQEMTASLVGPRWNEEDENDSSNPIFVTPK
jgi:hypothetical protein